LIGAPLSGALVAVGTEGPVVSAAAALVALALAATGVAALAWRRLGGFTGDVLGAVCLIAETVALLTLAAKW
jgi:adenosylcobinamide-GDP ribazoletransferase